MSFLPLMQEKLAEHQTAVLPVLARADSPLVLRAACSAGTVRTNCRIEPSEDH